MIRFCLERKVYTNSKLTHLDEFLRNNTGKIDFSFFVRGKIMSNMIPNSLFLRKRPALPRINVPKKFHSGKQNSM